MKDTVPTESELKIPVDDLGPLRDRLLELGAMCVTAATREKNLVYDFTQRSLFAGGNILRLRQYAGTSILTFKGPVRYEGQVKLREELEVEVSEAETMSTVLLRLGLVPLARYDKDREVWRLRSLTVTLDATPMGEFVEIEGESSLLAEVASSLGLDPQAAVRGSYLSLWRQYRQEHPDQHLPEDMVFDR